MKGIVFTEFIEMVESKWGLAMVDKILDPEGLPSEGIYTSVGTYDDREIGILVTRLGDETGMGLDELQKHFGKYLFGTFASGYEAMVGAFDNTFDLLSKLDDFIHPEVQKLYPEATLPGFEITHRDDQVLRMNYRSQRRMPDFAEGLILAAAKHYKEEVAVTWHPSTEEENLFEFEVTKTT